MAIFDHEVRSATLRARVRCEVLTIDKKNFLKRIHKDPSLAFKSSKPCRSESAISVTRLRA